MFRRSLLFLSSLLFVFLTQQYVIGSDTTNVDPGYPDSHEKLRIFIDCKDCDDDYIRLDIRFVDHVRNPHVADVQIQITNQKTAAGGKEYLLKFIGHGKYNGLNDTLTYISQISDSRDIIRKSISKLIKAGLIHYLSPTEILWHVDISSNAEDEPGSPVKGTDPWKNWVFNIGLAGEIEAEKSRNEFNVITNFYASRITDRWRFGSQLDYTYEEENFSEDSGEDIKSSLREWEWNSSLVKSLSPHWSTGLFKNVDITTYRNIQFGIELAPAVEYNFFRWAESGSRILAVAYYNGIRYFNYFEETIYGKTEETLWAEAVIVQMDFIQPWGNLTMDFEASHYLHDFSKNKIEMRAEIAHRLIEGLSFSFQLEWKMIHDQLYLPRGDATLEEILLKEKKLATTYELSSYFKISYTFGSIYNNIVNRRLQ